MKTFLMIFAVLLVAGAAFAATDDEVITVSVTSIENIDVPATGALTLATESGTTAGSYTQATLAQANGCHVNHNQTSTRKVSASAVHNTGNAANDVSLGCTLAGGAGAQVLVNAGTDAGAKDMRTGMAAGHYLLNLDWTADGTLATTKTGSYEWTVTFTTSAG